MATAGPSKKRRVNICEEPSTLVYTLLNPDKLSFKNFSLIIRSLHTYMVEDIVPYADKNCVHVKLNYQASVKNAGMKLGKLSKFVSVHKLSTFVKDDELSTLDQLQRDFGFGAHDDETPNKKVVRPQKRGRYLPSTAVLEEDSESEHE